MVGTEIVLAERGFIADGRLMENGEARFRLQASDGTAYIRTEASQEGGWQNGHRHEGMCETYIIQKGWIIAAEERPRTGRTWKMYTVGKIYKTTEGIDHNIFLSKGSIIHTVKHGTPRPNPAKKGNDWYDGDPAFDAWSKALTLADFAARLGCTVELLQG